MDEPTPVELFERHHLRVYRFLLRMTAGASLAEDLTQEVFVRAFSGLEQYRSRGREASWVFRIARNRLDDTRRKNRRSPVGADAPALETVAAPGDPTLGHDDPPPLGGSRRKPLDGSDRLSHTSTDNLTEAERWLQRAR
jgi:RNA polymerase sigma factor (sigma-70 family)